MSSLALVDRDRAAGAVRESLDELAARGPLGPMARGMANSSALLRGYLDLNRVMKRSHLDRRISERSRWSPRRRRSMSLPAPSTWSPGIHPTATARSAA